MLSECVFFFLAFKVSTAQFPTFSKPSNKGSGDSLFPHLTLPNTPTRASFRCHFSAIQKKKKQFSPPFSLVSAIFSATKERGSRRKRQLPWSLGIMTLHMLLPNPNHPYSIHNHCDTNHS